MPAEPRKVMVKVLIGKLMTDWGLFRKGEEFEVEEDWAKARGNSIQILSPDADVPYTDPATAPETAIADILLGDKVEEGSLPTPTPQKPKETPKKVKR